MRLSKQRYITCNGWSEPVHKLHTEAAIHFLKITAFLLKRYCHIQNTSSVKDIQDSLFTESHWLLDSFNKHPDFH